MRYKTYLRLFFLVLVASISFLLFSYSRKTAENSDKNEECGKCNQKKTQTEFILWESLSRNFLSASR
ncbi:MAG TPA: hypothetical protein VL832_21370 [Puia sp.]|jgi:hypothetical protein|nr:hypothetical protein [Puia sp.]